MDKIMARLFQIEETNGQKNGSAEESTARHYPPEEHTPKGNSLERECSMKTMSFFCHHRAQNISFSRGLLKIFELCKIP